MSETPAKATLVGKVVRICQRLTGEHLVGILASGNVSARFRTPYAVAITAKGAKLDEITPAAVSFMEGSSDAWDGPTPSTELLLHLAVYEYTTALCVAHLHSPWTTAFSVTNHKNLPHLHYSQALLGEAPTPFVGYRTPGTRDLAKALQAQQKAFVNNNRAVLLRNHGSLVWAETPENLLAYCVTLEEACRLALVTAGVSVRHLVPAQIKDASRMYNDYYAS